MSDLKFDQFEIKFFLIVSCLIVVAALVVAELFSSPSDEMRGGGGATWVDFYWVCAADLSKPLPLYSILWSIKDSILLTFVNMVQLLNR